MARENPGSRAKIPSLSKYLLVGQSLIIITLSLWLFKEYQNNRYLQTYLSSVFQGQGSIATLLGLGGIMAIGFVGILLKAGNLMREIEHLSSKVDDRTDAAPTLEASAPSTMPFLEVVGTRPIDDISRIHRSMRRWNERSKRFDSDS